MIICRKRIDGKFVGQGGLIPTSQAICSSLLEECFEIVHEIRALDESKNVASSLKPIYDRLTEIRRELESLVSTAVSSLVSCVLSNSMVFKGLDSPMEFTRNRLVELQLEPPRNRQDEDRWAVCGFGRQSTDGPIRESELRRCVAFFDSDDLVIGTALSAPAMLWPHLPPLVFK